MFESPLKQNLSSPILATMFLLQSPEGARRRAPNYLQCFYLYSPEGVTCLALPMLYRLEIASFPYPPLI